MSASMRAAVYKGSRTVEVEDVPVPEVGPTQVLLEVSHCGICGTDLHMMLEDWGIPGSVGGHEYSGVVRAVGAEVSGWSVGDRAVGGPGAGCGSCPACDVGDTHLCRSRGRAGLDVTLGAFASHKLVDAGSLFAVPPGLDLRTAALTEPVAVALRGVRRVDVGPGSRVLVTGAGPIGVLTVAVLRSRGVTDITVSEPGERRRALATRVGATSTVLPEDLVPPDLPMDVVDRPYRAAFECSGRREATEAALAQLDRGGVLVLSGTGMQKLRLDPNRMILNELVVTGTFEYTREDFEMALDLLASGALPTEDLIEPEDLPLSSLRWGMEELAAGRLAAKALVAPNA